MEYTSSERNHYAGLDALRGVAALAVVAYHFSTRIDALFFFAHGYLAVDFFFALSGFVIVRAYSLRLADGQLSVWRFYLMRVIRLIPMVVCGTLTAAIIEFGRPAVSDQAAHLFDIIYATALGSLLVPILWKTTLEAVVFPLDGPVWSLFFEAFINGVFGPVARLEICTIFFVSACFVSGPLLAVLTLSLGTIDFGSLPETFWFGFPRVCWSFGMGVILFSYRKFAPRVPFSVSACILVVILAIPNLENWNGAYDCFCVIVVFPCLLLCASSSEFGTNGRRVAKLSGDLSYPVYALHYPLVRALSLVGRKLELEPLGKVPFLAGALVLITAISWIVYVKYDVPLRRLLANRLPRRAK